jgi:hypothetical protein
MHPSGELLLRSGASRRTTVPYHSRTIPYYTLRCLEGANAGAGADVGLRSASADCTSTPPCSSHTSMIGPGRDSLDEPSSSSSTSPIPCKAMALPDIPYQSMPYFNLIPSDLVPDGATTTAASTYSSSRLCRENLKLLYSLLIQ